MAPADALAALDAVPREQIPAAIVRLTARLIDEPRPAAVPSAADDDYLTADEVAELLKTDRRFVYRHARALGAVRLSARKLRFPRKRVTRFLERKI